MQAVAIGWYLYDLTGSAMTLAYAGLAVFAPIAIFTLPGGDLADRFDRRRILVAAHLLQAVCAGTLVALATARTHAPAPFYAVLALSGTARAFSGPAVPSLLPLLVPRASFPNAVALSSSANQTAVVLGPAVGGLIYLLGPEVTFGACLAMSLVVAFCMGSIRTPGGASVAPAGTSIARALEGFRYLRLKPILLGAISLDLFAVLLGGITGLLPIYARDILGVGPQGLGLMRSSMAVGAVTMAIFLARLPAQRQPHAGHALFGGVALFGAAVIAFAVSTSIYLSVAVLAVMGAADMLSVFVRASVVQLGAPDEMRGRVSAVHMLFVGATNELGDFRAGAMAAWLGAVPAALAGGAATLAVVALWRALFPQLRNLARLSDIKT
jgi:MFS family permease